MPDPRLLSKQEVIDLCKTERGKNLLERFMLSDTPINTDPAGTRILSGNYKDGNDFCQLHVTIKEDLGPIAFRRFASIFKKWSDRIYTEEKAPGEDFRFFQRRIKIMTERMSNEMVLFVLRLEEALEDFDPPVFPATFHLMSLEEAAEMTGEELPE